jgi:hypothetical protein
VTFLLKRVLPILISLLYVLSPLDVLPDVFPGVGWMDDLLVVGAMLWYLGSQRGSRIPWEVFTRMRGARPGSRDVGPDDLTGNFDRMDPYELLEVPRTATADEIKAAYKRAVTRYHPDKVAHLGKEFQDLAHTKLLAIQRAYATLGGGRR